MSPEKIALFGVIVSTLGLIVGLYTLFRVRRVAKAQTEERRITQELLGVDEIERDLQRVINRLFENNDGDSYHLANDLSHRLGAIQGTRRAIERSRDNRMNIECVEVKKGFFSGRHVDDLIDGSTAHLDIITGSTRLISGFYTMDKIRQACERGVRVRVVGLDPNAPDEILLDASKTVTTPAPTNATEYRNLINENHKTIIEQIALWESEAVKERFEYRAHIGVPRISIARRDDLIDLGFLQLFRDAQPREVRNRQYIEISKGSSLGDVVMKHFEKAWAEGRTIITTSSDEIIDNTNGSEMPT